MSNERRRAGLFLDHTLPHHEENRQEEHQEFRHSEADSTMARHYSHARGRRRTHHKRRNTANRSMVVRDPKGAPSPTAFLKLLYSNIISTSNWNGASFKEFSDGTKRRLPSLYTAYANSLVAVYASSPPPVPPADRFLYAAEWGTLYNFFIVHASRITLKFTCTSQTGWLAVWPSLQNAVTGPVPVNQETLFGIPGAKVKFFASTQDGGTDRGMTTLSNYVKFDQFLPRDFYQGSLLTGALPHTSHTSGFPYYPGGVPALPVYWNFQFFSTNEDNNGEVAGDLSIQIENYVELMEPWISDPEYVMLSTEERAAQLGIQLTVPSTPMIQKFDVQEDYKTVILDPAFKTGNQMKAEEGVPDIVYPTIDPEPEPEEFITVQVPKSSVKGSTK